MFEVSFNINHQIKAIFVTYSNNSNGDSDGDGDAIKLLTTR